MPKRFTLNNSSAETKLSARKGISMSEKIQLFERFKQTGQELNGKTVFEGQLIGRWAIQIRNEFYNGRRMYSKEVIDKLSTLGILERGMESTMDEKIKYLADWSAKYPRALVSMSEIPSELIKEYTNSEDEAKKMIDEHQRMHKYYKYIKLRRIKGKLTEEQLKSCKEGNVRGVFGYSTKVEDLAKKYRIDEDKIIYILDKYKTMDNFISAYRTGQLSKSDIEILSSNLKKCFDVNLTEHKGQEAFIKEAMEIETPYITDENLNLYDSNTIEEALKTVTEKQKNVVVERFRFERWDNKIIRKS